MYFTEQVSTPVVPVALARSLKRVPGFLLIKGLQCEAFLR